MRKTKNFKSSNVFVFKHKQNLHFSFVLFFHCAFAFAIQEYNDCMILFFIFFFVSTLRPLSLSISACTIQCLIPRSNPKWNENHSENMDFVQPSWFEYYRRPIQFSLVMFGSGLGLHMLAFKNWMFRRKYWRKKWLLFDVAHCTLHIELTCQPVTFCQFNFRFYFAFHYRNFFHPISS